MRIKLDENLPASLASTLTALAHEVHTVAEEDLSGSKTMSCGKQLNESRFSSSHKIWISPIRGSSLLEHILAFCWFDYVRRTGAH
jgi:hypothetical protein